MPENSKKVAAKAAVNLRASHASPIGIPASQDWEGNDGPWSSFALQIGTPPQNVKVMVSTAATQTWVVLPQGCTVLDPANCAKSRGSVFMPNSSSTWSPNLASPNGLFNLGLEEDLGIYGNGLYGFDNITLGWQGSGGPSLVNQTIAGIATKDFYLGVFGLCPRPSNFSTFNEPVPSPMETLKVQNLIPSLSWGYTAGNQYRLDKVLGSLTLGGYDSSKFIPNNVNFPFSQQEARDLTVTLSSIYTSNSISATPLLPQKISTFVDSTIPYIYLPIEACKLFEAAFNLTYDSTSSLYLLNETQHGALMSHNLNITFTLTNNENQSINITFPYAAFDLTAQYPLVNTSTRYFPLKRAANESQYTLGRTFLQEAYIIADYERKTFSISQSKHGTSNTEQTLIPILPPVIESSNTTTLISQPSSSSKISGGIIGGIIAAAVILIAIIGTGSIVIFRIIKPRRRRREEEKHQNDLSKLNSAKKRFSRETPQNFLTPEMEGPYTKGNLGGIHESAAAPKYELATTFSDDIPEADGCEKYELESPCTEIDGRSKYELESPTTEIDGVPRNGLESPLTERSELDGSGVSHELAATELSTRRL